MPPAFGAARPTGCEKPRTESLGGEMNLDDLKQMQALDPQDMLGYIRNLPDQLEEAWNAGQSLPLPDSRSTIRQIVIAGMGGSAIGGSILSAYAAPLSDVPIIVRRDYSLPAWAKGPETLVVASSFSGNTEETISAYSSALENRCSVLAMTTGGKLSALAEKDGVPLWNFHFQGQPRAAVGYTFALPCALVSRLGRIPDPSQDIAGAAATMRARREEIDAGVPSAKNAAKIMAARCVGKSVVVFGADYLAPIARRWKGQVSEAAKAWSQFEEFPELDHNTASGSLQPREVIERSIVVLLRSKFNHPRNVLRIDITRDLFRTHGWQTAEYPATGDGPLAQMFSCLHFGDYVSWYLAMAYSTDPSPVPIIEDLKKRLAR
jgi:glucose/mannose-6-phosphate isomerase